MAQTRARRQELLEGLYAVPDRVASTIREHVVDSKVNNIRRIDPTDPSLIEPIDLAR